MKLKWEDDNGNWVELMLPKEHDVLFITVARTEDQEGSERVVQMPAIEAIAFLEIMVDRYRHHHVDE